MPSWADKWQAYAALASTLISLISVFFVVTSLRHASSALQAQHKSTDVATVITIFERLDAHWLRFKKANEENHASFEFGQLVSYYELSCRLFRDRIFQTKAAYTLYEHLHDVLSSMLKSEDFKRRFEEIKSQPDNYENITWLCSQPRFLDHTEKTRLVRFFGCITSVNSH